MSSVRTVNIGRSRPRGAGFPFSCGCGRLSRQACQTLLGEVGEDVPQPADDALARLFGRAVGAARLRTEERLGRREQGEAPAVAVSASTWPSRLPITTLTAS